MANTAQPVFDVRHYGCKGDGSTDDTANFAKAITAAKAYVSANAGSRPTVSVPRGVYILGTSTLAGSSAVLMDGTGIRLAGEGMLKLAAGSAADGVLRVTGNSNWVQDITVDGNASGSPSGRGECIRITGDYNTFYNVQAQNSKTTGGTGIDFLIQEDTDGTPTSASIGGYGNKLVCCNSQNAGYNGIDCRGDRTTIRDCNVIGFGHHGFNKAGGYTEKFTINGLYLESDNANVTEPLIVDPGAVDSYYVRHVDIRNVVIWNCGAADNFIKMSRCHYITLDNIHVWHSEAFPSITFVEAIKSLKISNSYFSRAINFDETGGVTGSISSVADSASTPGRARFTCSGSHSLLVGDTIYIVAASGDTTYNGFYEVLAVPGSTTFEVNSQWTTSAMTGNFYQCTGEVVLDNVTVGDGVHDVWTISGIRTPKFKMRNCRVTTDNQTKLIAPKNSYPITAIERYDIENCSFQFKRDATDAVVLMGETATTELFTTSRKLRWVNNNVKNLASTRSYSLLYASDAAVLATSRDAGTDYTLTSNTFPSGSTVTWQVGDRFFKPTPVIGTSPGWICTTAGTFSGGTFKQMAPLSGGVLTAGITEVGNVGGGEDNLITYTLPANTLNVTGDSLEIEAGFTFNTNGNTKTIKLYLGSTDLLALSGSAQNGGSYFVRAICIRDISNILKVSVVGSAYGASGTPLGGIGGNVFNHTADMTGALTIKGTGTGTSDNDVVMEFLRVRMSPAP